MSHRLRASPSVEPRFPVVFALADGPWLARHVEAIETALLELLRREVGAVAAGGVLQREGQRR